MKDDGRIPRIKDTDMTDRLLTAGAIAEDTRNPIGDIAACFPFRPGVRLSVARVEPLSRMPWTQRCGVECEMSYSALISRAGSPFSYNCTICRLNDSS